MVKIDNREEWIKAAWENFDEAVGNSDVSMAKAIIADAQEYGFLDEARKMNETLRNHANTNGILSTTIAFLKQKRSEYQEDGLIPTLDLVIEDLENELEELSQ